MFKQHRTLFSTGQLPENKAGYVVFIANVVIDIRFY